MSFTPVQEISNTALVEAKNEYTKQLVSILSPLIYEGFETIFEDALAEFEIKEAEKRKYIRAVDSDDEISDLQYFQDLIKKIPGWNQDIIDRETRRIIDKSRCPWLEGLLEAVFVTNSKILSMPRTKNPSGEVGITYPKLRNFVHKCYVVCGFEVYQNAYLFDNEDITPIQKQKNAKEIMNIIKEGIVETIRIMEPTEEIIKNYFGNMEEQKINSFNKEEPTETSVVESIKNEDTNNNIETANMFKQLVKSVEESEKKLEEEESDESTEENSEEESTKENTEGGVVIRENTEQVNVTEAKTETQTEVTETTEVKENFVQPVLEENVSIKSLNDFRPPLMEKPLHIENIYEPETKDILPRRALESEDITESSGITEEDVKKISDSHRMERAQRRIIRNKDKIRMERERIERERLEREKILHQQNISLHENNEISSQSVAEVNTEVKNDAFLNVKEQLMMGGDDERRTSYFSTGEDYRSDY